MRRHLLLLLPLLVSGCSTVSTPSPTPLTPATFVMTWPPPAFGATQVATTAATPIAITLSNFGAAAVPVTSASSNNAAEFPVTTTCSLGGSLAPKATCQVVVKFIPSATGARTATLTINANSTTQTIDFSGTGVAGVKPQISIDLTTGPPSTIFTLTVTGATPSSTLTLNTVFTAPGGPAATTSVGGYATDANGGATIATNSDNAGTYENWVVDATTGTSSNHVTHSVK